MSLLELFVPWTISVKNTKRKGIKACLKMVFDTAEGMALATDQRELWEAERGVPLEADAARDIADYTRNQWEVEL